MQSAFRRAADFLLRIIFAQSLAIDEQTYHSCRCVSLWASPCERQRTMEVHEDGKKRERTNGKNIYINNTPLAGTDGLTVHAICLLLAMLFRGARTSKWQMCIILDGCVLCTQRNFSFHISSCTRSSVTADVFHVHVESGERRHAMCVGMLACGREEGEKESERARE